MWGASTTESQSRGGEIRAAVAAGLPRGAALMDAGYGVNSQFRSALTELGLR
jgi:SRSO17 transposase